MAGAWVLLWQCYWWMRLGTWMPMSPAMALLMLGGPGADAFPRWRGLETVLGVMPLTWTLWAASFLAMKARGLATATPARKA